MYYQQGDVLFFVVNEEEVQGKKVKADVRGYVFAEGEVTGHYHAVKETDKMEVYEKNGVKYCRVFENATVEHQEHGAIVLPEGNYQIGIVKEFDPFKKEIAKIRD